MAAHFRYGHALDADFEQGVFHRIKPRRLDDRFDFLHQLSLPLVIAEFFRGDHRLPGAWAHHARVRARSPTADFAFNESQFYRPLRI